MRPHEVRQLFLPLAKFG